MRGKWHFVTTTIFIVFLWIIFGLWLGKPYFNITQVIAAIPISFFPDIDQNFKMLGHRNWFTHSIILWVVIYLFNPHFIFLLLMLGIGFHCLMDIRLQPKKQVGYYTIKWYGYRGTNLKYSYKGMDGLLSTYYLTINFAISFIVFITIVLVN